MGILNVTPDSFSDGGIYLTPTKAVNRVKEMVTEGASIIDIGGESTGPGSVHVDLKEELRRVILIITRLSPRLGGGSRLQERKNIEAGQNSRLQNYRISVDTYKAEVARQALEAGADIVNDVTALRGDVEMARVVAEYKCPVILMYAKDDTPRTTSKKTRYKDVVQTIGDFFEERISFALGAGIQRNNIILDPGMGAFVSAIPKYSVEIIARLGELKKRFGLPILVGPSRKSFLGGKITERLEAGLSASCLAYQNGASIIRTHDVLECRGVLNTAWEIEHGSNGSNG